VFFENSTATRTTFEIAAKRLSDVVNLNTASSSTSKGETLLDTVDNLCCDARRHVRGAPCAERRGAFFIARHVAPDVHVINAGDGRHAHPTQALLDMFNDPPLQERIPQPARGDRRRRAAFARRTLADHALTTLGFLKCASSAPNGCCRRLMGRRDRRRAVYHERWRAGFNGRMW